MPAVARMKDLCTGHDAFAPRRIRWGSINVYINNRACARAHDRLQFHQNMLGQHDARIAKREKCTVWVNGRPAALLKDVLDDALPQPYIESYIPEQRRGDTQELIHHNYKGMFELEPRPSEEDGKCESIIMTASHNVFFENETL